MAGQPLLLRLLASSGQGPRTPSMALPVVNTAALEVMFPAVALAAGLRAASLPTDRLAAYPAN